MTTPTWHILKFGGTSVSSRTAWNHIAEIVGSHQPSLESRLVIVCSAASGVSDLLEQAISSAEADDFSTPLQAITTRYQQLADELEVSHDLLAPDLAALKTHLETCQKTSVSSDARATIMSFGELLLTKIGHAFLASHMTCCWQDARDLLTAIPPPNAAHDPTHVLISKLLNGP